MSAYKEFLEKANPRSADSLSKQRAEELLAFLKSPYQNYRRIDGFTFKVEEPFIHWYLKTSFTKEEVFQFLSWLSP